MVGEFNPEENKNVAEEKAETPKKTVAKKVKKNIYQKLLAIQANLKAPKNMYNSFGKYKYRSAEGILEALKPYLAEQECVLILKDEIYNEGTNSETASKDGIVTTKEMPNNYIKAIATFIDCETGESIETSAYARECQHTGMSADQCTGCASSYARKYCLNALFLLDDTKDSDTDEVKNIENAAKEKKSWGQQNNTSQGTGWGNKNTATQQDSVPQQNKGWGKK